MKLVKLCLSLLILVFVSSVIHAEEDSQLNEAATLETKAVILKKAAAHPEKAAKHSVKDATHSVKDAAHSVKEATHSIKEDQPSVVDRMKAIDDVNPKKWGIRKNCLLISSIRSINFRNDQSAIVDIGRGKEVLLRLRRECKGIRSEGFMYTARGPRLCARFDRFELLRSKRICQIESFEPHLVVEDAEEDNL